MKSIAEYLFKSADFIRHEGWDNKKKDAPWKTQRKTCTASNFFPFLDQLFRSYFFSAKTGENKKGKRSKTQAKKVEDRSWVKFLVRMCDKARELARKPERHRIRRGEGATSSLKRNDTLRQGNQQLREFREVLPGKVRIKQILCQVWIDSKR